MLSKKIIPFYKIDSCSKISYSIKLKVMYLQKFIACEKSSF